MLIYSAPVFVLFLIFALLYWHAFRQSRERLELDAIGVFDARTGMWRHLLTSGIALGSIAIAVLLPGRASWAGMIYFLVGPLHALFGFVRGKSREKLSAMPA
jgi:hypothetical protein